MFGLVDSAPQVSPSDGRRPVESDQPSRSHLASATGGHRFEKGQEVVAVDGGLACEALLGADGGPSVGDDHWVELRPAIAKFSEEWMRMAAGVGVLDSAGVPWEVSDPDFVMSLFNDPALRAKGWVTSYQHAAGKIDVFGLLFDLDRAPGVIQRASLSGAHPGRSQYSKCA